MIFLATKKDIAKLSDELSEIRDSVTAVVNVLDMCYGEDRDYFKALGGFACVIESPEDVEVLKDEYYLDILNDIYEEEESFENYIGRLFVLSSDYAIKVYCRRELIT